MALKLDSYRFMRRVEERRLILDPDEIRAEWERIRRISKRTSGPPLQQPQDVNDEDIGLYISGNYTEIGPEDNKVVLYGGGVVRYNLKTRELENVVDGANGSTSYLFLRL